MKYTDALKIYNQGKSKWCFPRKGSKDHGKILKIQGKTTAKAVVKKDPKKKAVVKKDPKKKNEVKKDKIPKSVSKKPKSVSKKVFINDAVKAESKTPAFVEVSRN